MQQVKQNWWTPWYQSPWLEPTPTGTFGEPIYCETNVKQKRPQGNKQQHQLTFNLGSIIILDLVKLQYFVTKFGVPRLHDWSAMLRWQLRRLRRWVQVDRRPAELQSPGRAPSHPAPRSAGCPMETTKRRNGDRLDDQKRAEKRRAYGLCIFQTPYKTVN